jgi:hypothetical protein
VDPDLHQDPDPHCFGNIDPHPDPHPHQIGIRIIICDKLDPEPDPDPRQFAENKPKCSNMSLF